MDQLGSVFSHIQLLEVELFLASWTTFLYAFCFKAQLNNLLVPTPRGKDVAGGSWKFLNDFIKR